MASSLAPRGADLVIDGAGSCAVCGGRTAPGRLGRNTVDRCSDCGFALVAGAAPKPDYWGFGPDETAVSEFFLGSRRRYFESALGLLETLTPGRRLLDVGGGVGFFAERARGRGWAAVSLDSSPSVRPRAVERLGPEAVWDTLPDGARGTFDAITLWCVIAHTRTPHELAALAADAARPGGYVWLTTPNMAFERPYAVARLLIQRPIDFAAEDHIGHFSVRAIRTLLRREGFEDVQFHFRGVTEACLLAGGARSRVLVGGKYAWNRLALAAARLGLPNYVSELQVTARRATSR